jgi:hypothetical protein
MVCHPTNGYPSIIRRTGVLAPDAVASESLEMVRGFYSVRPGGVGHRTWRATPRTMWMRLSDARKGLCMGRDELRFGLSPGWSGSNSIVLVIAIQTPKS